MLYSQRYRNNYGYQIQATRRDPIFSRHLRRPNRNHYQYDGYNTLMTFDTLTNSDINVSQSKSQNVIKHSYPGYKPGFDEDQKYDSLSKNLMQALMGAKGKASASLGRQEAQGQQGSGMHGDGVRDVVRKIGSIIRQGPFKAYTSQGASQVRNTLGSIIHKQDRNWRPGHKGELHIPGHSFCGPGTNLDIRLKRGDPGLNILDRACKVHDIDYALAKDAGDVRRADQALLKNIKKAKWGVNRGLIRAIFKRKMRRENRGKLSPGKYAYDNPNKTQMDPETLSKHRDEAQAALSGGGVMEVIGESARGIEKIMKKARKKDPARKLRNKMKKYKKGQKRSNRAMRAALKRIRSRMMHK